jgi:hypothetical protein
MHSKIPTELRGDCIGGYVLHEGGVCGANDDDSLLHFLLHKQFDDCKHKPKPDGLVAHNQTSNANRKTVLPAQNGSVVAVSDDDDGGSGGSSGGGCTQSYVEHEQEGCRGSTQ